MKQLKGQLFPPHLHRGEENISMFDSSPAAARTEENIGCMRACLESVMPTENRDKLSGTEATPVKWREFLNCHVCKRSLVVYLGSAFTHYTSLNSLIIS